MASGLCFSGWITYILRKYVEWDWKETYPVVFGVYAVIGLIKAGLTLLLTERCEPNHSLHAEADITEQDASAPLMSDNRRSSYTKTPQVKATMRKIGETVTTRISPESRPIPDPPLFPLRHQLLRHGHVTSHAHVLVRHLAV